MNVQLLLNAAVVVVMAAAAPAARAQATETLPSAGPTMQAASVAVRPSLTFGASVPQAWNAERALKRSETLMIVGGAIFLAGAIIGDDAGTIIMISGAAVGIYGLYLYLQ